MPNHKKKKKAAEILTVSWRLLCAIIWISKYHINEFREKQIDELYGFFFKYRNKSDLRSPTNIFYYPILAYITHRDISRKLKFVNSVPIWDEKVELPDGLHPISMNNYF